MQTPNLVGLGKLYKFDRCRKYFPRYDEQTFLQQVNYTEGQLIQYFPQRFIEEYQSFKKAGTTIKIGFWAFDIAFVSFCHKIKLLTKILGEKSWRMFTFKIAAIAFPLGFMNQIQDDAKEQFYKGLYRNVHKFYRRYKQTGDILDLNINIILEQKETQLQKICQLNKFNLVHQINQENQSAKVNKVV